MFKRSTAPSSPSAPSAASIDELAQAVQAAAVRGRRGSWGMRLEEERFDPTLAPVVSAFNATLETMQQRQTWLEAILDAVPLLLSVTDMDMNWTFVNKAIEDLAGVTRQEIVGKHCSALGAPSCKDHNCGVATLKRGEPSSFTELAGANLQIKTAYVTDRQGNQLGHVEVIQDVTSLVRSSQYQEFEAKRFAEYLERLSNGDLSFTPEVGEGDEHTVEARKNFLEIASGMDRTLTNLRGLIGDLQASATEVAEAGAQIHGASEQSAQTTQEVAGTIQQVAADANMSTEAAASVTEIAESGRKTVEQTVEAMRSIDAGVSEAGASIREMRELSTRIGAIVQTIDDIADQTNLLALNAAIEAARAGEHGRGFAVVADEVRKLADRSSQATKEIGGLIRDVQSGIQGAGEAMDRSIEQVTQGTQLAAGAGESLAQIASAAARSDQQAARIAEGATGVAATTEEMSAQIEELTASAQTLARVSDQLRAHTERFQLADQLPRPLRLAA
jgi:methyl-accepting chemotaxis protein